MKIRKGEVVIAISPYDWIKYREAGWKKVQEPTAEQNRINNEKQRLKRLAKGGSSNAD